MVLVHRADASISDVFYNLMCSTCWTGGGFVALVLVVLLLAWWPCWLLLGCFQVSGSGGLLCWCFGCCFFWWWCKTYVCSQWCSAYGGPKKNDCWWPLCSSWKLSPQSYYQTNEVRNNNKQQKFYLIRLAAFFIPLLVFSFDDLMKQQFPYLVVL
uniref:Transmembrane protein n=1 Tax=Meloidogyne hapla TaxID=6305 RepID=A0A1I8BCP2_MELHA